MSDKDRRMTARLLRAIILLPGNVLVFIPAAAIWATGADLASPEDTRFWLALLIALLSLVLMGWTVSLFTGPGEGTPAPWDPPKKLVILGPYRHTRNPMITGVVIFLGAESLMFWSWPLAAWMVTFLIANVFYFPFNEEKRLERRFGDDYLRYKANVPRWIPKIRPWNGD